MQIHEIIRTRRTALGLTQEQLAGKLGVSAPAVNKWERGNSYPDITLLPVLARTLRVDLNTLLSFREDLTETEIAEFLNRLYEVSRTEGCGAAFSLAEEKLRQFPNSDALAYSAAGLLEGLLTLFPGTDETARPGREDFVAGLYEQAAQSADPKIREWATYTVASRCIARGDLDRAEALVREAARGMPDLDLILLPECVDFLARSPEEALAQAQPIPGPYTMRMSRLARELRVNLVPGSITERTESGKVRNTTVWIDREGEILGRYSKMHLFDALNYRESDHVQAGDEICLLDTDIGRVGIQICYDCRFPELARTQVLKGADLLCVMACFPLGAPLPVRTEHWDLLIDSMALLNQTWVCAANQFGTVAGQHPFGRSRITDPWGTAVAVAGGRPGVIYGVLDLKYQRECREQVGGLHNRRPELYFQ